MISKVSLVSIIPKFIKTCKHKVSMQVVKNFRNTIQPSKDTFERSVSKSSIETLNYNPNIIIGNYSYKTNDERIAILSTEYRAYDFEGYDDKFPDEYICIDSRGDRRMKPHIYLKFIEVKPKFARQGAYKQALKELIDYSKSEECEGRITLDALDIESPDTIKIPSPSLAHWNCGFRFADDRHNKVMQKVLRGELPLEDAPRGSMYLKLD